MVKSPLRALVPILIGLGALGLLPAMNFITAQEPPEEVPCSPKQHTGTVVQPICSVTVVWADTKTPGDCPDDPCNFTDFKAVLDYCDSSDIVEVKFPGQNWQAISGSGPHLFNLPGSLQVPCGEHATKTTRLRTSTGTEGSLEMVLECTVCP